MVLELSLLSCRARKGEEALQPATAGSLPSKGQPFTFRAGQAAAEGGDSKNGLANGHGKLHFKRIRMLHGNSIVSIMLISLLVSKVSEF